MDKRYEKLLKCRDYVRSVTDFVPKAALVLGSGLGGFAEALDVVCEVPYSDIPGFPVSTVPGHAGKFIFGYLDGAPVVCMQGRVHYYEGYELSDVVLPARLMHLLGAELLFLTNASGGVNPKFDAGDFMLITDHIMLFFPNPLVGANIEELGTRFPDMSHVYDPELCDIIRGVAKDAGIAMQEGVYCQLTGPCFETPACRIPSCAGCASRSTSWPPVPLARSLRTAWASSPPFGMVCCPAIPRTCASKSSPPARRRWRSPGSITSRGSCGAGTFSARGWRWRNS